MSARPTTVYIEVTNTLAVDFLTGFQRHTREIVRHLPGPDATGDLRVVPIVWCRSLRDYRRLTDAEARRLHDPAPTTARAGGATSPGWRRAIAPLATLAPVARLRHEVERRRDPAGTLRELAALRVTFEPGSILFDLEAAWEDPVARPELLADLGGRGVTTTALVADVMPELFPQWFRPGTVERFSPFIRAHLRHREGFAWISEATERDSHELAARLGIHRDLRGRVVTLGSDLPATGEEQPPPWMSGRRALLCVGTLEPRKHQDLALDVFERLRDRHPDVVLVLAGREGWGVDELVTRLRAHPDRHDRVRWLGSITDVELATLYRHAFLVLVPSRYEGYGVPVIEALAHGVPTISSDGGALPEAGGDLVEYAGPDDLDRWVELVERHLDDPAHHDEVRRGLAGHRLPTWSGAGSAIADLLVEVATSARR
jgi:glycosyltransferase involved in cell wall biosynthesis